MSVFRRPWRPSVRRRWVGTVPPTVVSGSDSATATDTQTALTATVPGSESGALTEAGTVSVTLSSADTPTATDVGTVAATASGSDSGTATDTGVPSVTGSGSDSGTGTEGGTASVSASGSDSATAAEGQSLDTGATPVSGSDSASTSEAGTVAVTASDSDLAAATEGQMLDTGVVPSVPGPTGGRYEPGGDETSIYGEVRLLFDADIAVAGEVWAVDDRTPREPERPRLRIRLPRRAEPRVAADRDVRGRDGIAGLEFSLVAASAAGVDRAFVLEASSLRVIDPEEEALLEAGILAGFGLSGL